MFDFDKLKNAMGELDEEAALEIVEQITDSADAQQAVEACQQGLQEVGDLFESGEYFVADLIFSGEIMEGVLNVLKPLLAGVQKESVGKLILCTVEGDLHDIGKNIVRSLLEAAGFEVVDLGIDVAPAKIVETAKAEGIKIIALSGVLTLALDSMRKTVEALKEAGLRDQVKVIIGGAPATAEAMEMTGADEWAKNPQKTVDVCKAWASA